MHLSAPQQATPGVLVIYVILLYILVVVLIRSKGLHKILSYGITQL